MAKSRDHFKQSVHSLYSRLERERQRMRTLTEAQVGAAKSALPPPLLNLSFGTGAGANPNSGSPPPKPSPEQTEEEDDAEADADSTVDAVRSALRSMADDLAKLSQGSLEQEDPVEARKGPSMKLGGSRGGSGNAIRSKLQSLEAERNELLASGVYTPDDAVLQYLEAEIAAAGRA